jgi:hypothetical protein
MEAKTAARWAIVALFGLFLLGVLFQLWQVGELVFDDTVDEISDVHKDVGQVLQFSGIVIFLVALAGRFSARELILFAVFAVLAFLQAGFAEGEGLTFTNRLHVINPLVLSAIAGLYGWKIYKELQSG